MAVGGGADAGGAGVAEAEAGVGWVVAGDGEFFGVYGVDVEGSNFLFGGDPFGFGSSPADEVEFLVLGRWCGGQLHRRGVQCRGGEFGQDDVALVGAGVEGEFGDGNTGVFFACGVGAEESPGAQERVGGFQARVLGRVLREAGSDGGDPLGVDEDAGAGAVAGDDFGHVEVFAVAGCAAVADRGGWDGAQAGDRDDRDAGAGDEFGGPSFDHGVGSFSHEGPWCAEQVGAGCGTWGLP